MMPGYRFMDLYPLQGNQMPSAQNYYPSFEAFQPSGKVDPSKSVVINQPFLNPSNFNYSVPCYPWSSHCNFPGCYGHGPYPHFPTPQFHCCGHHPPFPDAFPVPYVSPPYYLKELPRYDYDKPRDNGYHCCGCPNHLRSHKNGDTVRVEEQEPNVENKMSHFAVPFQLNNYPYPVLWIPPEYMKNKEQRKTSESDGASREKASEDIKPPQNGMLNEQAAAPREWHSWFPHDMKSLQSLLRGDDGRKTWDQQEVDKMKQFPFPIFWMPSYSKQGEVQKEEPGGVSAAPGFVGDPVNSNSDDGMNRSLEIKENYGSQVDPVLKEKINNQRSIPVMQVEVSKEKDNSENDERRGRAVSPKTGEEDGVGKAPRASARRESSSSPKASKLPPVCLRVDPLPHKKNGSKTSRSPSPPGNEGKSQETTKNAPKISVSSDQRSQNYQNSQVEVEKNKNKGNAVQVAERKSNEHKFKEQSSVSETQIPVSSSVDSGEKHFSSQTTQESAKNGVNYAVKKDTGSKNVDEATTKQTNEIKETNTADRPNTAETKEDKRKLPNEAAVRIQSAFKGYQMRKWEPLKKLKQIAKVQDQLVEVRKKIHDLESFTDLQKDEKQMAIVGEMIMSQLLKLDTIQGLHPSLRDVRKSLARELVTLQEKLDLLSKAKSSEKPSTDPNNMRGIQGEVRDSGECPISDVTQRINVASETEGNETSKSSPCVETAKQLAASPEVQMGMSITGTRQTEERDSIISESSLSAAVVADSDNAVQVSETNLRNELPVGVIDIEEPVKHEQVGQLEDVSLLGGDVEEKATMDAIEQQPIYGDSKGQMAVNTFAAVVDDSGNAVQVPETNLLNELPVGVIDIEESLKHERAEQLEDISLLGGDVEEKATMDALVQQPIDGDNKRQMAVDTSAAVVDDLGNAVEVPETNLLNELPVGVIDIEEPLKYEQAAELENASLLCGDVEEKATMDALEQQPINGDSKGQVAVDASAAIVDDSGITVEVSETDLLNELPFGVIDVEEPLKHKRAEQLGNVSLLGGDVDEKATMVALEQQPIDVDYCNNLDKPTREHVNKEITQEQGEQHELESIGSNIAAHLPEQPMSMLAEHGREKRAIEPCMEEHEREMEEARNLAEENEKMREMVEKLIESGKEQLAVISNLTGRVKDLEKMLRKKNKRAKRYKTALSSFSPSTKSPRTRAASAAA